MLVYVGHGLEGIARRVVFGLADKRIAEQTGRPLTTVRTDVKRVLRRTGLENRTKAAGPGRAQRGSARGVTAL